VGSSAVIEVAGLSKRYGRSGGGREAGQDGDVRTLALDDVSFSVGRGEIVGLLGPNGAGKSTMMRILTCFLAPTRGRATLNGCSIADDARGVRRAVGYLPEAVPLPPEMRVDEYLRFRAGLKGLRRGARRGAIDEAFALAGLGDRRRQIIGTLSRGYRQRVGLADALLARPPILILDEPTAGLDPNQIRETRETIRTLGRERTVLLSTHILPEVEAIATRVVILNRGRIVAAEPTAALHSRVAGARRIVVEVAPSALARAEAVLRGVDGIAGVERLDDARLALVADAAHDDDAPLREAVFRAAAAGGLVLRGLATETATLEAIFSRMTS
jgi:ABC-2 type transport system ATP-binding protein